MRSCYDLEMSVRLGRPTSAKLPKVPLSETFSTSGKSSLMRKPGVKCPPKGTCSADTPNAVRPLCLCYFVAVDGANRVADRVIEGPTVSNRHCVVFNEIKGGNRKAIVEDLSANGTFVNEAFIGRNKRRELKDGDEIAIVDAARFVFRYPQNMHTDGFRQQFTIQEQLGKGHFATVYLCIERSTGTRFAVKKFEKRNSPSERSKMEGLQQEIAVLMSVNHPSLLCLKATFDETDAVFLVLELAPEGELFNYIITKHKLTEAEARNIFCQLLQGLKYLVSTMLAGTRPLLMTVA